MSKGKRKYGARFNLALGLALEHGSIEGEHHKMWVIDQMVRALTGCPIIEGEVSLRGKLLYTYQKQGESEEYKDYVTHHNDGEDGPDTYVWETGRMP